MYLTSIGDLKNKALNIHYSCLVQQVLKYLHVGLLYRQPGLRECASQEMLHLFEQYLLQWLAMIALYEDPFPGFHSDLEPFLSTGLTSDPQRAGQYIAENLFALLPAI